jgi:trans-aconitate 2-methyltransferase
MGVAAHLGIDLREYDTRIRTFIPAYEEMLDVAASVLDLAVAAPRVLDLGIGSGALSYRVLRVRPRARIVGVDSDPGMLGLAARRLGGRLTTVEGDFSRALVDRGRFDAMTASFALHHVRTKRRKVSLYARCFDALEMQGILVNADCCLSTSPELQREDRSFWRAHLERSYTPAAARRFLLAWAREDVYFTLDDEVRMMKAAGFEVDVVWRRRSFAVLAGRRKRTSRR